jgi:hypothetical protein
LPRRFPHHRKQPVARRKYVILHGTLAYPLISHS